MIHATAPRVRCGQCNNSWCVALLDVWFRDDLTCVVMNESGLSASKAAPFMASAPATFQLLGKSL